jgi:outer membrane protein OmpA-like peptidoglycan-associated protein
MMNLIDLAKGYLSPELIEKASTLVGDTPTTTRRALDTAVPTIVMGVAERASSPSGAESVISVLRGSGLVGAMGPILDRLQGMGGEELVEYGKDLLGRFMGPRLGANVDVAAAATGVKSSTMSSLMGMAAPFVLGALGHQVHSRNMSPSDLATMLTEQKSFATKAIPTGVSATPARERISTVSAERESEKVSSAARWLPLLLIPLVIIGAVLSRRRAERPTPEATAAGLGAGIAPEAPPVEPPTVAPPPTPPPPAAPAHVGSAPINVPLVAEVEQFLESTGGEGSKHFVLEDLNFEFATTHPTPKSLATIDELAKVLKAHPGARIEVQGHTDNVGLPAANQRMSLERANAVKSALVTRGVSADHVTTKGLGEAQPLASNDTPEGRAKNRRTEIVVTR